jgi:acyl-CoA thioester hydrolase
MGLSAQNDILLLGKISDLRGQGRSLREDVGRSALQRCRRHPRYNDAVTAPRAYRVSIPIRFADIDALGHVNNAVFLTYMEVARTAFWTERIGEVRVQEIDFVLARVEIDYRRPVLFNDALACDLWIEKIGRSSFTVGYRFLVDDTPVAEARSVQVFVDLPTGASKPVPDAFRERVREFLSED